MEKRDFAGHRPLPARRDEPDRACHHAAADPQAMRGTHRMAGTADQIQ